MSEIAQTEQGLWSASVFDALASQLLHALDPVVPFVVVEGHSPSSAGWEELAVPLSSKSGSAIRRVRNVRFDLLLSPGEALSMGADFDRAGDGWLSLWQCDQSPPEQLSLDQKRGKARADAIRGVGVSLVIDLPHARTKALLASPDEAALQRAIDRLSRLR